MTQMPSARRTDDGAALVLALLLAMALSAIAVSLIFLSETETMSSVNYRLMSQARYGAEAGIHKSINHLLNNYAKPGTAGDPLAAYDLTVSPVTFGGQPVVLSSVTGVASNYPIGATATAFTNAAQGTLAVGGYNVQYTATATLLSMRQIPVFGSGVDTIQTWRITAIGNIAGNRPAQVEVTSLLETQAVPSHTYGLFATSPVCGAITFNGNAVSNSYDSTSMAMSGGSPVTQDAGGDVGTNGNLTIGGHVSINGSLSTPRSGVGNCNDGNVNALSETGQADVTGGVIQLPQTIKYPTPALPSPLPPTTDNAIDNTCAGAGIAGGVCSGPSGNLTLTPGGALVHLALGNVKMTGGCTLHLNAGIYDINSISLTGNSTLIIDSGPVVFNVVGTGEATPIDFAGGGIQNPTFKPGQFEILYAGTGGVKIAGGSKSSAMVFAPNADVAIVGGSHFYGAVLGNTITDTGGTNYHYDRSLQDDFFVVGNWMLSAFSWKKY